MQVRGLATFLYNVAIKACLIHNFLHKEMTVLHVSQEYGSCFFHSFKELKLLILPFDKGLSNSNNKHIFTLGILQNDLRSVRIHQIF